MSEFIAINFEAAKRRTSSSVEIGCVENGAVTNRGSFHIRPVPEFRFNSLNMSINGIRPEMCEKAPEWGTTLSIDS